MNKPEEDPDDVVPLYLRLPRAMSDRIKLAASADARSVNAWCLVELEHALRRPRGKR